MEQLNKKKHFNMPHTFVIIGIILLICVILCFIIPSGEFDRVIDENGRSVVVAGTYHEAEGTKPTLLSVFMAIFNGMGDASDIIFFIFFSYGLVYVTLETGALDAGIGTLLRIMKNKTSLLVPFFMLLFGVLGSTIGLYEETYGLLPVFMGLFIALGYDPLVGAAVVWIGTVSGFAAGTTNPFSVGIAQGIAGIPMYSGLGYRIVLFVVFMIATITYVVIYARRVKQNPRLSPVYDVDFSHLSTKESSELEQMKFTGRQKLVLIAFLCVIGIVVFGTLKYKWYLAEIGAVFIIGMIVVGLIGGFTLSNIMEKFVKSVGIMAGGALVVGVSRSILLVMQDAMIIDSIVYYLSNSLEGANTYIAAVGMVFVQNIIDFFIPSSSAQAATTMPIMVPLGELLGLSPQISVLALQLGAGFSDLFWPTAVATSCGVMRVPLNKWYKFVGKLFIIHLTLQAVAMIVAVAINYA